MTNVSSLRLNNSLRSALGPHISEILSDPITTDILRNADGCLWVDKIGGGRKYTGHTMSDDDATIALSLIADSCGEPITRKTPILSTTLPGSGERIAGTFPPITSSPTFAIRKPPKKVFNVSDYFTEVGTDKGDSGSCVFRCNLDKVLWAVRNHKNILIAGGTGAAKTSLLSALLQDESVSTDRLVVIEDAKEIVISSPDHVRMITSKSAGITQKELVELSLRQRPDRIVIGEIRSPDAAFEMVMALNTGHGGSMTTIHASSCLRAMDRLDSLCAAAVKGKVPSKEIANAIDCVVFIKKINYTGERAVVDVKFVHTWENGKYSMSDCPNLGIQ